ncbi:MAG: ABC transporter substrate-binding protein [Myxococcota bacterium]|nr:ABC transporter substrate-binding protein [Myxococcota bacterium]
MHHRVKIAGWVLLLVGAGLIPSARAAAPARVVILKSADRTAYSQVVAGFSSEARARVSEVTLQEGRGEAVQRENAALLARIAQENPALVLAIGPTAANAAKKALTRTPVVFCMVPYFEKYGLEGANVTGIGMTSDLSVELTMLRSLGEGIRRVGILHDPRYSSQVVAQAVAQAKPRGLTIVPLEADSQSRAEQVLAGARDKIDALLMVADKTVATESLVRLLIGKTRSAGIPLVALSPTQVKEGALVSIAPTPTGIGQQAGRLANRIVHEKVDPGALAVSGPELLEVSWNLSAARGLGSTCELTTELFKLAAARGYPLRVYE